MHQGAARSARRWWPCAFFRKASFRVPVKSLIVDQLGERALLLPQMLADALAANDRVKFLLTLLQTAERRADRPGGAAPDLSLERKAAGVADAGFDRALGEASRDVSGALHVPDAPKLRKDILDGIAAMRAPLELAGVAGAAELARREAALSAALPLFAGDLVPQGVVDRITSGDRARGDSLHILVMDLHRALNALQAELAEESIDGAHVWRIDDGDRALVAAFMKGLNETKPLKFDHPGLGTTATRSGDRLVIQNDIGTTDAHVLVVHVEGLTATVTYTDIHAQRAAFFQSLFKPFGVRWDDTRTRQGDHLEEENYYLCVGVYEAADGPALERYLAYLGSRIVFLIDWNHTRKVLREFLRKPDGVKLLKWAADNNVGQRGFLVLGGERLLYEAIEFIQQAPLHYGEKLHEALGGEQALDYLKFVFRAATEGLMQGRSERFIRDEVKTELARRFHGAQESLISIASAHAAFVFELATELHDGLSRLDEGEAVFARVAGRAAHWEQEADGLVSRVRSLVRRLRKPEIFRELMHEADDAADSLEEAAFLATFLPKLGVERKLVAPVEELSGLLVEGARELVKMFEAAAHVRRDGSRDDLQDFLEAVDRLIAIEHETDRVERAARGALLLGAPDFRVLELVGNLARTLEEAADALSRTALMLRDHIVNDVMGG
jgi:uncharacterized protein Yka (UPF0111/DUF47 family)